MDTPGTGADALHTLVRNGLSRLAADIHRWQIWSEQIRQLEGLTVPDNNTLREMGVAHNDRSDASYALRVSGDVTPRPCPAPTGDPA